MKQILEQLKAQGIVPVSVSSLARKNDREMEFSYDVSGASEVAPNLFRSGELFQFPLYAGIDYTQARCRVDVERDVGEFLEKKFHAQVIKSKDVKQAKKIIDDLGNLLCDLSTCRGVWWTEKPSNAENPEYMMDMARKVMTVFSPYMFNELKKDHGIRLKYTFEKHRGTEVPVMYNLN